LLKSDNNALVPIILNEKSIHSHCGPLDTKQLWQFASTNHQILNLSIQVYQTWGGKDTSHWRHWLGWWAVFIFKIQIFSIPLWEAIQNLNKYL